MSRRLNHSHDFIDEEDDSIIKLRNKVGMLKTVSNNYQSDTLNTLSSFVLCPSQLTWRFNSFVLSSQVSIQIGEETREQNRFLMQQDSAADSILSRLSLNMDQVKSLARAGHNRLVFYLLGFALFVMLVIYFITKSL